MKHWDGLDLAGAEPVALPPEDEARLAALIAPRKRARGRRAPGDLGSLVGLALSLGFLAGMVWAVSPSEPVAAELKKQ